LRYWNKAIMKKIVFILFLFIEVLNINAQNKTIDSLEVKLKVCKSDKEKISTLNQLSWEYYLISNFDAAKSTAESAIKLNRNINSELASSYHRLGDSYYGKSNFDQALQFYMKSLEISEKINNNNGILASYTGIGTVYISIRNNLKSNEYFNKALVLSDSLRDKKGKANSLISLGNIYYMNGDLLKSKEYYLNALQLEIENKNEVNIALLYSNLGNIYFGNDYKKTTEYYQKSIVIRERINDSRGLTDSYYNLALAYIELKQYDKSLYYLNKAKDLSIKTGSKETLMNCYNGYADLYECMGDIPHAYEYHQQYSKLKDTVFNIQSTQNINKLNALYESEKKNKTIELLNKEKEKEHLLSEAKEQKNKIILFSSILVILTVVSFSFWIYKKFKETSKQKQIIELQKKEVEEQKHLIEQHQKEIKDSINYAKRIQSSFMASESEFKEKIKDYFILFNPKDVVSGDFYWAGNTEEHLYICVADSTGHGIPGAFMSLLNISLLNEALLSKGLKNTNEILDFVRKILILGLKPDESGQGGNDGMDCTLLKLNIKTKQIQISGANNPLWIIRNNELIEIEVDKMPVGRSPKENIPFKSTTFQLQENDLVIMFTDGYADQFGGPKGKKFKYKQLNELLINASDKPLNEQSIRLQKTFANWKGDLEQVDDVCIIGIKI